VVRPSKIFIKSLETIIFNFIWDGNGRERIKRESLKKPVYLGGIGIMDIENRCAAFEAAKILDLTNRHTLWFGIGNYFFNLAFRKQIESLIQINTPKYTGNKCFKAERLHYKNIIFKESYAIKDIYQQIIKLKEPIKHRIENIEIRRDWNITWQNLGGAMCKSKIRENNLLRLHKMLQTEENIISNTRGIEKRTILEERVWGLKGNIKREGCKFCGELEHQDHIFYTCKPVQKIVKKVLYHFDMPYDEIRYRDGLKLLPQDMKERILYMIISDKIWEERQKRKTKEIKSESQITLDIINGMYKHLNIFELA
jgi:hypothetical protein